MLNTLANHGFLPRDGKRISLENLTNAIDHINFAPDIAEDLFGFILSTIPTGERSGAFSLKDLGRHNILEHDASIS